MSDIQDTQTISGDYVLSIRVPNELHEKTENAARETGLKKADIIRLSLDRGVDILLAQLTTAPLVTVAAFPEVES